MLKRGLLLALLIIVIDLEFYRTVLPVCNL